MTATRSMRLLVERPETQPKVFRLGLRVEQGTLAKGSDGQRQNSNSEINFKSRRSVARSSGVS
jgi:hypothetical protein